MIFKKYSSVENSFDEEYIQKVRWQMPPDLKYAVQEKVHGANASFLCDGSEIRFAKRTALVGTDESFYGCTDLVNLYRDKILALTRDVMRRSLGITQVSIFGELFGGCYPHPDVPAIRNMVPVQKGVYYCPGHEFYGFDIYVIQENEGNFLSVEETDALFEKNGFFHAKTLFTGTLDECLAYPNAFVSHVPEWLGLPPIEDNICEGIVIRPVIPMFLWNGSRVMIKSKNERFAEKKAQRGPAPELDPGAGYSDEMKELVAVLATYITEPRLDNVISHIGDVQLPRDFGMLTGLYAKDIFEDYMKENAVAYNELERKEQKAIKKELARLSAEMIKSSISISERGDSPGSGCSANPTPESKE